MNERSGENESQSHKVMPQRPVNVHVLGAVPLGVVGVSVPDLPDELIVRRVTSYEVICAPPESLGVPPGQPGRVIPRLSVDMWSSHHQEGVKCLTLKLTPPHARTVMVLAMGNPNLTKSPAS